MTKVFPKTKIDIKNLEQELVALQKQQILNTLLQTFIRRQINKARMDAIKTSMDTWIPSEVESQNQIDF